MTTATILDTRKALLRLLELDDTKGLKLPGDVRMRLAALARELHQAFADYEKARVGLVKEMGRKEGGGWEIKSDCPRWGEFVAEMEKVLAMEREIAVPTFTPKELKVDENNLPISLLEDLLAVNLLK